MAFVASTDEPYRSWGSGAIGHRLTLPVTDKIRSRGNRVSVGLELCLGRVCQLFSSLDIIGCPCWIAHSEQPLNRCEQLVRSEEHTSELQSQSNLVCRLLLEKNKK